MSVETLQNILRYAEGLDISEGEYLKVANCLKTIFEKEDKKSIWITINTSGLTTIQIILNECYSNNKVILNIKSVSASNIGIPRPTSFKFSVEVNLYESASVDTPFKTYEMISTDKCSNKLETILEMFGPKKITIKLEELEITYNCYSFLKEWKERCIEDYKLDDDEDAEIDNSFTDTTFRSIVLNKIHMFCKDWFWIKHNEIKENDE